MAKNHVPWDALAGLFAVSVALGIAEFVTGALGSGSLVIAVGDYVIDHAPGGAARAAIDAFGKNDKSALVVAIVAAVLALGAAAGVAAARWFAAGAAVVAAMALVGALAGAAAPLNSDAKSLIAGTLAATAGILVLRVLVGAVPGRADGGEEGEGAIGRLRADRRRFFRLSGGALGVAIVSLLTGRWGFEAPVDVEGDREAIRLPTPLPSDGPGPDPAAVALQAEGISPLITPNEDFYRIDTALTVRRVDVDGWRLKVTGLVDRPFELSYPELLALGVREETVTLCCVSNEVGGDLVGNARWLGVTLREVLERAGVRPEGTQVVARSVDGFTTAFPTDVALDGRASMIAVGMNGEVLPAEHGFPARMIVPGLYGYVSATKWLTEIELTTLEDFKAFWITRGWSQEGPIKTQSRIDIPPEGATIMAGRVQIGGVAWAGVRGVGAVEVRVVEAAAGKASFGADWARLMPPDFGEWRTTRLSGVLSSSSWRQWILDWDAAPGTYRVEVRATDGRGDTQSYLRQPPEPDGATGYHGVGITVRGS